MYPKQLKYATTHEWIQIQVNAGIVGITDFAVKKLTDLVYVELPRVGDKLTRGSLFGSVESVKAVSDLNSPVSGEVIEVHEELYQKIDLISKNPYGEGWLIKVNVENPQELNKLMDSQEYEALVSKKE